MRVFANIADKVTAVADNVAKGWLPANTAGADGGRQQLVLRRILLSGVAGSIVAPVALLPVLGTAVALPAGVGAALAVSLLSAVAVSSRANKRATTDKVTTSSGAEPAASGISCTYVPGLMTFHNAAGDVTEISGRDKNSLLQKPDRLKGKGFVENIHVSDRIAFLSAVDLLRQGQATAEVELRMAQGGHEAQFVSLKVFMTANFDDAAGLSGFVAQSLDNRVVVSAQADVERMRHEASSANEAKSRFLAAVSHELRTPLNAILGFSDILAGEYFGKLENDRQREYVDLINQSGNHLLSVVNTMLDMSKIEAGHYEIQTEPFMIAEVAHACEAMLAHQAKQKQVTLTFRTARQCGEVVADKRALKQVLINLVGNAIKFTDEGGVVSVDIAVRNNELELVVSDTGIGIPSDKIALLGKPFMQVQNEYSRNFEGTGLGLSLVKGLVALHGGAFAVESELGEGTVITVRLPADGSGAEIVRLHGTGDPNVEFPPRLQNDESEMQEFEVESHAKAQSA